MASEIYRRSLTFLLEAAFCHLFPGALLHVDYSLASGGYFCNVRGREPLTPDELKILEAENAAARGAGPSVSRARCPGRGCGLLYSRAGTIRQGPADPPPPQAHRDVYQLGDCFDYHHGFMVPSTGLSAVV